MHAVSPVSNIRPTTALLAVLTSHYKAVPWRGGSTLRSLNSNYTRTYTYHNHTACTIKRIMQTCSYVYSHAQVAQTYYAWIILPSIQNPHTAPLPLRMVNKAQPSVLPGLPKLSQGKLTEDRYLQLCGRGQHAMLFK